MMETFRAWPGQAERCYACGRPEAEHDPWPWCPAPTSWLHPWMRCACGRPLGVGAVTCDHCDQRPARRRAERLRLRWEYRRLSPVWPWLAWRRRELFEPSAAARQGCILRPLPWPQRALDRLALAWLHRGKDAGAVMRVPPGGVHGSP